MHHQPGNIIDKRGQNKATAKTQENKPPTPYFGEDFQPCHDFVLVETRFVGGSADSKVFIPDSVQEKQQFGIVRAVGPGRYLASGAIVPPPCKVGDYVHAAVGNPEARRVHFKDKNLTLLPGTLILGIFPTVPQEYKDAIEAEDRREEEHRLAALKRAEEARAALVQPPPPEPAPETASEFQTPDHE